MHAPTCMQVHRHLYSLFPLLACLGKTFGFHCISHTVVFFHSSCGNQTNQQGLQVGEGNSGTRVLTKS